MLIILATAYLGAAGLHGVLAVLFTTLWHAVLASVLMLVGLGFLVLTLRTARRPRTSPQRGHARPVPAQRAPSQPRRSTPQHPPDRPVPR
jgi:hypothetical protein